MTVRLSSGLKSNFNVVVGANCKLCVRDASEPSSVCECRGVYMGGVG